MPTGVYNRKASKRKLANASKGNGSRKDARKVIQTLVVDEEAMERIRAQVRKELIFSWLDKVL